MFTFCLLKLEMPGVSIYTICAVLSCSVVSDPLRPHGLQPARLLCPWAFYRQEYWSGLPCPPPGDLPDPGIEPMSPVLPVRFFTTEPPGKPKNTGVGSPALLQGIFPIQELNQGLLHCRQILYQLSYQGSHDLSYCSSENWPQGNEKRTTLEQKISCT